MTIPSHQEDKMKRRDRIYVTRSLPGSALERLRQACDVEINGEDRAPGKDELMAALKEKDGLLCLLTDRIDAEIMDACPKLKIISNCAVGYDNIDISAATERGIIVTNTPGVLTETTADLTWALLLTLARRVVEADRFVREGRFAGWSPTLLLGRDVHGKTLGIVGFGRIGRAVARRAIGFNMEILYFDVNRAPNELEAELSARFVDLRTLLSESDFVSLHLPLTPLTRHLIAEEELRQMKTSAFLINTSRGPIVDERALIRALEEGWIGGAALDVFEHEPDVPPELLKLPNVVLSPHIGSASVETRSEMAMMAVDNLLAVLQGCRPEHIVNPEVWPVRRT